MTKESILNTILSDSQDALKALVMFGESGTSERGEADVGAWLSWNFL